MSLRGALIQGCDAQKMMEKILVGIEIFPAEGLPLAWALGYLVRRSSWLPCLSFFSVRSNFAEIADLGDWIWDLEDPGPAGVYLHTTISLSYYDTYYAYLPSPLLPTT